MRPAARVCAPDRELTPFQSVAGLPAGSGGCILPM